MEIGAKDVMELRRVTGMPMMDVKKALEEAEGDREKAVELLRKRGLKAAEKKADRATGEGLLGFELSADGKVGTMLQVLCETEPVKNTPLFQSFVQRVTKLAVEQRPSDVEALLALPWPEPGADTVDLALKSLVGQIGENMRINAYTRFEAANGRVGAYAHHDRKTGALVALKGADAPGLADFAKQLCMHIVFSKPTALRREDIAADAVERELAFLRSQAAEDVALAGKPAQAVEGIVQGRLSKNFFGGCVLPEQPWFSDPSKRVADHLKAHGVEVVAFALFAATA